MPAVSIQKLRAGVFDGPQIRCLINDPAFLSSMSPREADAWRSFVLVVQSFLGNSRADNYVELVQNMLTCFHALGCRIKVHYFHGHLDRFPPNLGIVSDEQGERFHQDIRHHGRALSGSLGHAYDGGLSLESSARLPGHTTQQKGAYALFSGSI